MNAEQILHLPLNLQSHFRRLESDIVRTICEHINEIGRLTPDDLNKLEQMSKIGYDMQDIERQIAETIKKSEQQIYDMFAKATELELENYKSTYDLLGKPLVPFAENARLQALVEQISSATFGTFENISHTLGFVNTRGNWESIASTYRRTIDYAITQVQTGQETFYGAMRQTVRGIADSGIRYVEWESGYKRRLDSSVRMNLLDGLSRLSYEQAQDIGDEIGANGYEISWHSGHRPSHYFGGQQFATDEFNRDILPLMEEPNCYHKAFAIVLGISPPSYTKGELAELEAKEQEEHTFEGKSYNKYQAEQRQRQYETAIRRSKDRVNAFDAAGDGEAAQAEKIKLQRLRTSYTDFNKAVDLRPKWERT